MILLATIICICIIIILGIYVKDIHSAIVISIMAAFIGSVILGITVPIKMDKDEIKFHFTRTKYLVIVEEHQGNLYKISNDIQIYKSNKNDIIVYKVEDYNSYGYKINEYLEIERKKNE